MRGYNKSAAIYEEYSLLEILTWILENKPNANLRYANLRDADLRYANLRYANLRDANLRYANLRDANLRYANLRDADLSNADLSNADLSNADLRYANLRYADLRYADLRYANLRYANLRDADLRYANLRYADLRDADLSNAKNLLNPKSWLDSNFKKNKQGYIVFKAIGNTSYSISKNWEIEEGSFLEEEVNYIRSNDCGCGVNFGTKEFLKNNYLNSDSWWKCLLYFEDLSLLCVPYSTNGKARCGRLQLLEEIEKE